jgi:hypothetical protein
MDRRSVVAGLLLILGAGSSAAQSSRRLVYSQRTGEFFYAASPVLTAIASGYSGAGPHKNNPKSACISDLGPIPAGIYNIAPPEDLTLPDGHQIKYCLRLTPQLGTDTCGRTGFLIHGDSKVFPGWASAGCIIATRDVRLRIVQLGVDALDVRAGVDR